MSEIEDAKWLEDSIAGDHIKLYKYSDFRTVKQLGSGSYGRVILVEQKDCYFALKSFNNNEQTQVLREIVRELQLHRHVSDHDNIIRFYGVAKVGVEYSLVLEYADSALQLARAVEHLHEEDIIHRDLHGKNILIHQKKIKLADFGNLYNECWKREPAKRPNIQGIVSTLKSIISPVEIGTTSIDDIDEKKEIHSSEETNSELKLSKGTIDLNNELTSNDGLNISESNKVTVNLNNELFLSNDELKIVRRENEMSLQSQNHVNGLSSASQITIWNQNPGDQDYFTTIGDAKTGSSKTPNSHIAITNLPLRIPEIMFDSNWTGSNKFVQSSDSFIFSFRPGKKSSISTLSRVSDEKSAISDDDGHYIGFGHGDLYIFQSVCQKRDYMYPIHELPSFQMFNYEVFKVVKKEI
ncbi:unnamed protein product [Rhizophagus irregularis]|nr:unnamed protein product [Rhizophagus irregularis]